MIALRGARSVPWTSRKEGGSDGADVLALKLRSLADVENEQQQLGAELAQEEFAPMGCPSRQNSNMPLRPSMYLHIALRDI